MATSMPQRTGRREACLPPVESRTLLLSPLQEGSAAVLTQQLPHLLQRAQGCIVMRQGCRSRCARQRCNTLSRTGLCGGWGSSLRRHGGLRGYRIGTASNQVVDRGVVTLTCYGGPPLTGTGIGGPGHKLGFKGLGLLQILGAVEVQLPQFTGLAIDSEYRRTPTHNLMAYTAINVEAVLVERVDLVGPWLQFQALVSVTKTPVGGGNLPAVDALHFEFIGHHHGEHLRVG